MADYSKLEIDEIVRQAKAQKGHTVKVVTTTTPAPEPVTYRVVDKRAQQLEQAEELIRMFAEWMVENGHESDGQGFDSPLFKQWVNELGD